MRRWIALDADRRDQLARGDVREQTGPAVGLPDVLIP